MYDPELDEPVLWLDYLPTDVQIRIATYVSDNKSGLDALNLAKASPCQPHAVCTALDHTLENTFAEHQDGLVADWTHLFEDVRVLQLHEHPPNFELLYSPSLGTVVVEDEPIQLEALSRSGVSFDCLKLRARYGTPPYLVCRYLEFVNFRTLELCDLSNFWRNVNTEDLVAACDGVRSVYFDDDCWVYCGVANFLNALTSLHEFSIDLQGCGNLWELETVMKRLLRMRVSLWDNQLSDLINLAKDTHTSLTRIHVSSDDGLDKEAMLLLGQDVPELRSVESLFIYLYPGSEIYFPQLFNLSNLEICWERGYQPADDRDPFYKPEEGTILKLVEHHPSLKSLRLYYVRLSEEEVVAIIETLGTQLAKFGLSLECQDVAPHQRLLTVLKALTKNCNNLVELDLRCYIDWYYSKNLRECEKFRGGVKRELLFYLNRLQTRNAHLDMDETESLVLEFLEQNADDDDLEESEKELDNELQNGLALRSSRRGLNQSGDISHVIEMAKLLETGCDGLKLDLEAAVQAYRKAVCKGHFEAILKLWELTDKKSTQLSEPAQGGALDLMLELEDSGTTGMHVFADIFIDHTRSNPSTFRATATVLRHALDHGYTQPYAIELAKLIERGYEDIPPDPKSAIEIYKSVANDCGDTDALFWWAEWVYQGFGSQKPDPAEARTILESGVSKKCETCMNFLGVIVQEGYGDVEPNPKAARDLFQGAIERGGTSAMINLGMLYVKGFEGQTADPEKAIELFSRVLADNSHQLSPDSMHKLFSKNRDTLEPLNCRSNGSRSQGLNHECKSVPLANLSTYGYEDHPPNEEEAIRLYSDAMDADWSVLWHGRVHSRCAQQDITALHLPEIASHRFILFKIPRDRDTQLVLITSLSKSNCS